MKKIAYLVILCTFVLSITGCTQKEITINAEEILVNTMLITPNKEAKVVYVEDFSEPYYNLAELEEYVKSQVDTFNKKNMSGKIVLDQIMLKNGQAVMQLSFDSIATYSEFSEDDAYAYSATETKEFASFGVDMFVNAKDGSYVTKDIALSGKKQDVLIINEAYDLIINGKIKYYSNNAILVDENRLQTKAGETTVVVYRK